MRETKLRRNAERTLGGTSSRCICNGSFYNVIYQMVSERLHRKTSYWLRARWP